LENKNCSDKTGTLNIEKGDLETSLQTCENKLQDMDDEICIKSINAQ